MARILYIARTSLGAMGEAALSHYVYHVAKHHTIAVAETAHNDATVLSPPQGVTRRRLPSGPPNARKMALFDLISSFKPDIIHMIQSPYCFDDMMSLKPVFPDVKWVLDFRSPHIGPRDAPILDRFQAMHLHVDKLLTHARLSLKTNIRRNWRRSIEIPPGVDVSAISVAVKHKVPPRRFLYIGSISKTRQIGRMVDLFAATLDSTSPVSKQPKLDIIGSGNDVDDLNAHIFASGYAKQIRVLDPVPQAKLWQIMEKYDAGLAYVPMGDFESAPSLKSIEFAAAGLPVLASRTPGHEDFARRYNFRFHFFKNTPDDFAATVKSLEKKIRLDDQECNRKAAEALDWARIVEDYLLPVYAQLCR